MSDRLVKSGFYRKIKHFDLTGYEFIPHDYSTVEEAKEGAKKFCEVSPSSVVIVENFNNNKFTFIPLAGDPRTIIARVARALGGSIVDEVIVLK